jgi:hypothetical protein
MSVPQICILIRLEDGRPRVYVDAVSDGEYLRLADWLWSKPELTELIRLAVELQNKERAA